MTEDLTLALLQAIAKGDREAVLNLLARGLNPNGLVNDGPTPLDMAVIADRPQIARLLVAHGADVNAQKENGWTSLHVAAFEGRRNLVRVLIEEGAGLDAATEASSLSAAFFNSRFVRAYNSALFPGKSGRTAARRRTPGSIHRQAR
jgi:ankyrin repeat protein